MKQSEQLDKLAPALAKAQAEMGGAAKDSDNPFFKSKYADLTSVWKACKEALHNNGLTVIQSPIDREGRVGAATMLLHSSGQFVADEYTLGVKKKDDPQADGSSITYARRYALAAFVGVCPVDDDAESAMIRSDKPEPEKRPKEQPPIDRCLEKIASFTDLDEFQRYIDENWTKVEHAFRDAPACMKQANKASVDKLAQLTEEVANS